MLPQRSLHSFSVKKEVEVIIYVVYTFTDLGVRQISRPNQRIPWDTLLLFPSLWKKRQRRSGTASIQDSRPFQRSTNGERSVPKILWTVEFTTYQTAWAPTIVNMSQCQMRTKLWFFLLRLQRLLFHCTSSMCWCRWLTSDNWCWWLRRQQWRTCFQKECISARYLK